MQPIDWINLGWCSLQDWDSNHTLDALRVMGAMRMEVPDDKEDVVPSNLSEGHILGGMSWEERARDNIDTWWLTPAPVAYFEAAGEEGSGGGSEEVGEATPRNEGGQSATSSPGTDADTISGTTSDSATRTRQRPPPAEGLGEGSSTGTRDGSTSTPPPGGDELPPSRDREVASGSWTPLENPDDTDPRLVSKEPQLPDWASDLKFPVGWVGTVLSGTKNIERGPQDEILLPGFFGLVAPNRGGVAEMGTPVYELGRDKRPDFFGHLQSIFSVEKVNGGQVAIQLGTDKLRNKPGYMLLSDWNTGTLASGAAKQGGPLLTGGKGDQHRLGVSADGKPINALHLSTQTLFKGPGFDCPLAFELLTWPTPLPGPHPIPVHLVNDISSPHSWVKGAGSGLGRWYADSFIYSEGGEGEEIFVGPGSGGPGVTGGGGTGTGTGTGPAGGQPPPQGPAVSVGETVGSTARRAGGAVGGGAIGGLLTGPDLDESIVGGPWNEGPAEEEETDSVIPDLEGDPSEDSVVGELADAPDDVVDDLTDSAVLWNGDYYGGIIQNLPTWAVMTNRLLLGGGAQFRAEAWASGQPDYSGSAFMTDRDRAAVREAPVVGGFIGYAAGDGSWDGWEYTDDGGGGGRTTSAGGIMVLPPDVAVEDVVTGGFSSGDLVADSQFALTFPQGLGCVDFATPNESGVAGGGVRLEETAVGLRFGVTDSDGVVVASPQAIFGEGGWAITGNVSITGKLTVGGMIDPPGLSMTKSAADPGDALAFTIWVRTTDDRLMFSQAGADRVVAFQDEIATGRVSRTTGIDLTTTGTTLLFTVPTGETLVITRIAIVPTTDTGGSNPRLSFGFNGAASDVVISQVVADLDVGVARQFAIEGSSATGDATETLQINVVTASSATTLEAEVIVDGYFLSGGVTLVTGGGADVTAVHVDTAGEIRGITEKTLPVPTDILIMEDDGDSDNKKRIQVGNVRHAIGAGLAETSLQSIPNNTLTAVTFTSTDRWDPNGLHSTSVNPSRTTVLEDGKYLVTAGGKWALNATGFRQMVIRKNGTLALKVNTKNPTAGSATFQDVSVIADLVATDYVEMDVFQTSGGNLNFGGSATPQENNLELQKVAD